MRRPVQTRSHNIARCVSALTIAGALLLTSGAYADIFTYVDAKGRVNVSNIEPPEDARVTSIVRSKPSPPAPPEGTGDARGNPQVAALTRRIEQLEDELARNEPSPPPAPPVVYPTVVVPPPVVTTQAIVYAVPPSPQPAYDYGCASWWSGCGLWWGPPVVFVGSTPVSGRSDRFNHRRDPMMGNRGFTPRPPLFPSSLRATPP